MPIALAVLRLPTADIVLHRLYAAKASPLTAEKSTAVIPVLNQYKCIGVRLEFHELKLSNRHFQLMDIFAYHFYLPF